MILIMVAATTAAMGQKDSTGKKDSVLVPAFPRTDTVPALITYGDATTGNVKYTNGFILVSGYVIKKEGKLFWTEKPKATGFIDNKKKPLKNVIQYFDIK